MEDQISEQENGIRQSPVRRGDMEGRVIAITGATRGIGRATTLALARGGARLVVLARDRERLDVLADEVRRAGGEADAVVLDLASLASVRRAAAEVASRHRALHVLVNNAGVSLFRHATSADGFEMTYAVNHLGPFLLTNLLRPLLEAGAPARVITVTSRFERFGRLTSDSFRAGRRPLGGLRAYCGSKLANVLFTYAFAERLEGKGVTATCVHPGLVATDLMREWPRWMRALWDRFLQTPEEAARSVVHLATSPAIAKVTGCYFDRMRPSRSSRRSRDPALRAWLWRKSVELTTAADYGLRTAD